MQAKLAQAPSEHCSIERKASAATSVKNRTDQRKEESRAATPRAGVIESGPGIAGNVPSRTPAPGRSCGRVQCRGAQRHRRSDIAGAEPREVPPGARIE